MIRRPANIMICVTVVRVRRVRRTVQHSERCCGLHRTEGDRNATLPCSEHVSGRHERLHQQQREQPNEQVLTSATEHREVPKYSHATATLASRFCEE